MTHGGNTPPVFEPERLAAGTTEDPVLDELGRWFAHAPAPRGLDTASLARVARRLEGPGSTRRSLVRTVALSVALVIGAGGAAAAWGRYGAPWHFVTLLARERAAEPASTREKPRGVPSLHPTPELPAAPAATSTNAAGTSTNGAESPPDNATTAPNADTANPRSSARVTVPVPSAAIESDLARESAALERALTALRRDHDAAGALALLDRYAADFPAGVLRLEADVARVDANLALGNNAAALALLGRLPLERVGRGLELRLVRAELTAARDCQRANLDFDRVLAAHPATAFDERALFGRASCREKLGDAAGSHADLTTYLARYPAGRFAAAARAQLD